MLQGPKAEHRARIGLACPAWKAGAQPLGQRCRRAEDEIRTRVVCLGKAVPNHSATSAEDRATNGTRIRVIRLGKAAPDLSAIVALMLPLRHAVQQIPLWHGSHTIGIEALTGIEPA